MDKAFLCYARVDGTTARRLYKSLRAAGINAWLDEKDIPKGKPWDQAIEASLNESNVVIVLLTPEAVASDSVRNEISFALDNQKRVVPVLLRDCDIPLRIFRLQYIDFRTDYSRALPQLVRTLSSGGSGEPPTTLIPSDQTANRDVVVGPMYLKATPSEERQQHGLARLRGPLPLRRGLLYLLGALAVLGLGAISFCWFVLQRSPEVPDVRKAQVYQLRSTDWKALRFDAKILDDCMAYGPCMDRKAYVSALRETNWRSLSMDSSLLGDCMSYQPCLDRRDYADSLRTVDWKKQPVDSPFLTDCMSYQPCVDRRNYAASLRAVDWKKQPIGSHFLADCMSYQPCVDRKIYVTSLRSIDTAEAKERSGFQALLDGRYDDAIQAFQAAEDSYHTYHQALEITRLLRTERKALDDANARRAVFRNIVEKLAQDAPEEFLHKLQALITEPPPPPPEPDISGATVDFHTTGDDKDEAAKVSVTIGAASGAVFTWQEDRAEKWREESDKRVVLNRVAALPLSRLEKATIKVCIDRKRSHGWKFNYSGKLFIGSETVLSFEGQGKEIAHRAGSTCVEFPLR